MVEKGFYSHVTQKAYLLLVQKVNTALLDWQYVYYIAENIAKVPWFSVLGQRHSFNRGLADWVEGWSSTTLQEHDGRLHLFGGWDFF